MTINPAHMISSAGGRGVQPPRQHEQICFPLSHTPLGVHYSSPSPLRRTPKRRWGLYRGSGDQPYRQVLPKERGVKPQINTQSKALPGTTNPNNAIEAVSGYNDKPCPPDIVCGGSGVQPPVSTNRYAFHYLKRPWGFIIVHPRRCGEPQNGDRGCIGGAEIKTYSTPFNSAQWISPAGGRGGATPISTNRYTFHYLKRPWGFTIVHPRRCGEPQNDDKCCIRGA